MPAIYSKGSGYFHKRQTPRTIFIYLLAVALTVQILLPLPNLPVARATDFDIPDGDIAALKAALNVPGPSHNINLALNGVYTLTTVDNVVPYGTFNLVQGLPVITREITINGNGATIVRSYDPGTLDFRIFLVTDTGKLTLNHLTINNGYETANSGGAAIFNYNASLNVNFVTFSGNRSTGGGGAIFNVGLGVDGGAGPITPVTATLTGLSTNI